MRGRSQINDRHAKFFEGLFTNSAINVGFFSIHADLTYLSCGDKYLDDTGIYTNPYVWVAYARKRLAGFLMFAG